MKPLNPNRSSYGTGIDVSTSQTEKKNIEKKNSGKLTTVVSNPKISSRLTTALGLQDLPGQPIVVDMSVARVMVDQMQAGFSPLQVIKGAFSGTSDIGAQPAIQFNIVGPSPSSFKAPSFFQAVDSFNPNRQFFINNGVDIRVQNALLRFIPPVGSINLPADNKPRALHTVFMIDNVPVFEHIQANLVSSASDWSFVAQTADGYWNGYVPSGSFFYAIMFFSDGLTGLKTIHDPGELFELSLLALGVPVGCQVPL